MKPEDVPEELLSLYGSNYMGNSPAVAARRAMAAVIPEIERRVREQVAAEIEANPMNECSGAVMECARIARREGR